MLDLDFKNELARRALTAPPGADDDLVMRIVLEDLLGDPRPDEGHFAVCGKRLAAGGATPVDRLTALETLETLRRGGRLALRPDRAAPNTHVHTNASFSIFRSPSEAVWRAVVEGVTIFGINDHYTLDGHAEFAAAARIVGMPATFSIEAVALSAEAQAAGELYNDPKNPGRTYLSGKGIVRPLAKDSVHAANLARMTAALARRNREMTGKLSRLLAERDPGLAFAFDDVMTLTPAGNVTERHICEYAALRLRERFSDPVKLSRFLAGFSENFDEGVLATEAGFQDWIRAEFLKVGRPAYADESSDAFVSWDVMRALYLSLGAIPTYPVLGNPIVDREKDIRGLLRELDAAGWHAIEVIPFRNTKARLAEILDAAADAGFPVMSGTEHNTKTPMPLLDENTLDPAFRPRLLDGAYFLLGHQALSAARGVGYVDDDGNVVADDRAVTIGVFTDLGRRMLAPSADRERLFDRALSALGR